MSTSFKQYAQQTVKNWWVSLLIGIVLIIFSILLLIQPAQAYVAISIVFSVCMFMSGIFEIVFSLSNSSFLPGWGWYFAGGVIDLMLGIVLMSNPELSMGVIPFLVAFWIMFRGFTCIGFSTDMHRLGVKDWGWFLVFGILAVLCSFAIMWQPAAGAATAVYFTSFAFFFIGVCRVMLACEFKKIKKAIDVPV